MTSNTFRLAQLLAMTETGGQLAGSKVNLYQNDLQPNPASPLTDFTPADYTGYVSQSVGTWSAPYMSPLQRATVAADSLTFAATGAGIANTVFGWYLTNTAGTVLLASRRFEEPITIMAAGQGFTLTPNFEYGE